ncbi:hypothetical protein PRUPE_1G192900 [Prunus persica]|uniref:EF-hand domain-containing protein n=1 Tax=Prunus persica TaxID=3760 RepID=A0A251QZX5_PRUPE|nr:hypothetical protein PRUPE_1G192900 [Prunus persica]
MATNGTPSPAQAPKSVDAKPVVTDEVQRVFKSFDANGDGKISVSELGNVLKALGSSVSADELQRVMGNLDTDRDGFICLDEFNAFWVSGSKDGNAAELCDAFQSLRPGPQRLHLGQRAPFGAQSTPTNAVWLCAAIGLLFGLPILKLDVAFTAFISVSTIGWVGSYAVPIFARLVMLKRTSNQDPFIWVEQAGQFAWWPSCGKQNGQKALLRHFKGEES